MAETFQFDLVSPERRLLSVAARQVQLPGMEGDLTAMPEHAPFLTTLRPGIVSVTTETDTADYVVTGGFAEISPKAATVLAEQAVPRAEASSAMLDDLKANAEKALADALEEARMGAAQRVRDVDQLRAQLGL